MIVRNFFSSGGEGGKLVLLPQSVFWNTFSCLWVSIFRDPGVCLMASSSFWYASLKIQKYPCLDRETCSSHAPSSRILKPSKARQLHHCNIWYWEQKLIDRLKIIDKFKKKLLHERSRGFWTFSVSQLQLITIPITK